MTLALAAALVAAPSAGAESSSFSGTCDTPVGDMVTLNPPMRMVPARVGFRVQGRELCTGELNGTPVWHAPATLDVRGRGMLGCLPGYSLDASGTLRFTGGTVTQVDDAVVPFQMIGKPSALGAPASMALPEWGFQMDGLDSGTAWGAFSPNMGQPGSSQHEQCRDGGLRELEVWTWFTTLQPLVGPAVGGADLTASLAIPAQRARTVRRRGIALAVQANAPVAIALTATAGSRVIGRRRADIATPDGGEVRLRLRLDRAGRRLLRRARPPTLAVVAEARHVSGETAEARATVRVRR